MKSFHVSGLSLCCGLTLVLVGCHDQWSPPPPRVLSPPIGTETPRPEREYPKPLPNEQYVVPNQPGVAPNPPARNEATEPLPAEMPQQYKDFWQAYQAVGNPRILVYVNRSLDGRIIAGDQTVAVPRVSDLAAEAAKALNYSQIEQSLSDDLSIANRVSMVTPSSVWAKLSGEDIKSLQAGQASVLPVIWKKLDTDVLIQVQPRLQRTTADGTDYVLIAEAMNVRGGQPLGHASVALPAPQDKTTIDKATGELTLSLMDDIRKTWSAPPAK